MDCSCNPPVLTCPVFHHQMSRILPICHYHFPAESNMKHVIVGIMPHLDVMI